MEDEVSSVSIRYQYCTRAALAADHAYEVPVCAIEEFWKRIVPAGVWVHAPVSPLSNPGFSIRLPVVVLLLAPCVTTNGCPPTVRVAVRGLAPVLAATE